MIILSLVIPHGVPLPCRGGVGVGAVICILLFSAFLQLPLKYEIGWGGEGGEGIFETFIKKVFLPLARARGFCKMTSPPSPPHPLRSERTVVGFYSFVLYKFLNIIVFRVNHYIFSISMNHFPWKTHVFSSRCQWLLLTVFFCFFIDHISCYILLSSPISNIFVRFVKICEISWMSQASTTRLLAKRLQKDKFRFILHQCLSGCWPSCAFHAHSVIFMSENTAVKDDSSGEQA